MSPIVTTIHPVLEDIAKDIGYESFLEFGKSKLIEYLESNLNKFSKDIQDYEKKYSMDFIRFQNEFDSISDKDIIEKEDDEMEWEWKLSAINSINDKLKDLKNNHLYTGNSPIKNNERRIVEYFNDLSKRDYSHHKNGEGFGEANADVFSYDSDATRGHFILDF